MTIEQIGYLLAVIGCLMLAAWVYGEIQRRAKPKRAPRPRSTTAPLKGDLMRPKEVSRLLGIPLSTLCMMRHDGRGPAFIQDGKPVYYRRADVQAWMARQTVAAPLLPNAFLGDRDPSDEAVHI